MVKIVNIEYIGHLNSCRIKILGILIDNWKKNEVMNFTDDMAEVLLKNNDFKLVKEGAEEVKEEVLPKEEKIDLENMSKDKLLDFTAQYEIEADYSMTKTTLKQIIKKYLDNKND